MSATAIGSRSCFSNLLANALTHGDPASPVVVEAHTGDREFVLAVANAGAPIPADMIERLFQPFSRASEQPGQQGLGLGLYIAAEIARAHDGTLEVASSEQETRFTFRMPLELSELRPGGPKRRQRSEPLIFQGVASAR